MPIQKKAKSVAARQRQQSARLGYRYPKTAPVSEAVSATTPNVIEVPQPQIVDVLIALKALGRNFDIVSRNEKALDTRLDAIAKRVHAVDANLLNAVNYMIGWIVYAPGNSASSADGLPTFEVDEPHWL